MEISKKEGGRLGYLDSIRGLAALLVVICHCWRMTSDDFQKTSQQWPPDSVRGFIFYCLSHLPEIGRSAVMVFFVLSGFVLALSLQKRPVSYVGFAAKRIFRIYPTFAFAVLLAYALHSCIGSPHPTDSLWLTYESKPDLSFPTLLKNLALWSTTGSNGLDRVMWSLVHEMRISLIFPAILFSVVRLSWRSLLVYAALSTACSISLLTLTGQVALGYEEKNFTLTFLDTGYYVIFFAAGTWLALERDRVAQKIAQLPISAIMALSAFMILLFVKDEYDIHSYAGIANDYLRGVGAIILIALALGLPRFEKALNHAVLVWLGRISYSLYLIHCVVLYAVVQTIGASWTVFQATAAIIVTALILAEIMAKGIERPFIRLGKKLAGQSS